MTGGRRATTVSRYPPGPEAFDVGGEEVSGIDVPPGRRPAVSALADLNGRWHRPALLTFATIVVAHWAEHIVQALQIWVFDMPRADARGALGYLVPWLVTSEWLHYAYAILMLAGLAVLLPGFRGPSRSVWVLALGIQAWHHFEHLLLLYQAQAGQNLFAEPVPTSVLQLLWPRPELHLFYNAVVTVPMLAAMWLHRSPPSPSDAAATCTCAGHATGALAPA